MSSFVWMKVLESTPERYDRGIRLLFGGRIDEVYARVAEIAAGPGRRVLDIGCGTGAVSLACAERGADVVGIDIDAGMLEVARAKDAPATGSVALLEAGVAEVEDHLPTASMDAVVSCLVFSELSEDEQAYALRIAASVLVPGGDLVIADEVVPEERPKRAWALVRRAPLAALTYALTQATTHPVRGLAARIEVAGFEAIVEERCGFGEMVVFHARRPA